MNPGVHRYWFTIVPAQQDKNYPDVWKYGPETHKSAAVEVIIPDYNNDNSEFDQNSNDDLYDVVLTIPDVDNKYEDQKISYFKIYRSNEFKDNEYLNGNYPYNGSSLSAGSYSVLYSYRNRVDNSSSLRSPAGTITITEGQSLNITATSTINQYIVDWWIQGPGT